MMNHLGYTYGEISVQAEFQGNLLVGSYWVGGRAREDKTGGYRIPPSKMNGRWNQVLKAVGHEY